MAVTAEKKRVRGEVLPLMEAFYTVQGEGFHTGKAAYFVRLGGCDVGCHWCDVKESWDAGQHSFLPVDDIVSRVVDRDVPVVVTGGEPTMWNMGPLTAALHARGKKVHLETSGAHAFSGEWDWICLSPKKLAPPRREYLLAAHELKVVVYNRHDLKWAEKYAGEVNDDCLLFLQPEWSKREEMMPLITSYVRENPRWRISLQTHKYLGIP